MDYIKEYKQYNLSEILSQFGISVSQIDDKIEFVNNIINTYGKSNTATFRNLTDILRHDVTSDFIKSFIEEKLSEYEEINRLVKLFDIIDDCRQELDDYYLGVRNNNSMYRHDSMYRYGITSHTVNSDKNGVARVEFGIYYQIIGDSYDKEKDIVYQMINRTKSMTGMKSYGEHKSEGVDRNGYGDYRYTGVGGKTCIHVEFYFE